MRPIRASRAVVLVVDGIGVDLWLTRWLLEYSGAHLAVALDTADALRWLSHNRADVVVLNLDGLGASAESFRSALRSSTAGASIPIIAVGARSRASTATSDQPDPHTRYLDVPVEPQQLVDLLGAVGTPDWAP